MNLTAESVVLAAEKPNLANVEATVDRRADLEKKQEQISQLLQQAGCEGLLILDPDNFAWLTSGAAAPPPRPPRRATGSRGGGRRRPSAALSPLRLHGGTDPALLRPDGDRAEVRLVRHRQPRLLLRRAGSHLPQGAQCGQQSERHL